VESRYTKGNYGRPWRRLRQQFLDSTYPWYCALQSEHCTAKGRMMEPTEIEVDHIRPHRGDATLRDDLTNLQVACKACHSWKTAQESGWGTSTAAQWSGG
jgi:5-methylcytosine-specific restriction protein A